MVKFYYANDGKHKLVAVFDDGTHTSFGALGYEDFTQHGDPKRKKLYLNRHKKREDWNNPKTAGALSKWILWNKPTLDASIEDYVKRFNMHLE
jgi:hypothetical protein